MAIIHQFFKITRHFGLKSHLLAADGVFEGNRFGMKRKPSVSVVVLSVFSVAEDWMAFIRHMHADLIFSAS